MIVLKRILVPTDFSEPSEIALMYAKALAKNFHGVLHILHVIEEKTLFYAKLTSSTFSPLETIIAEVEKNIREHLDKVLSPAEKDEYQAQLTTLTGSPFVEIVRYAKNQDIDLIIMGTHGRGPIAHMLMGGVAEKVVRKAPCPVLTVRPREHEFVMP
jgi:nucleotide-binding universal stress UspA family protein